MVASPACPVARRSSLAGSLPTGPGAHENAASQAPMSGSADDQRVHATPPSHRRSRHNRYRYRPGHSSSAGGSWGWICLGMCASSMVLSVVLPWPAHPGCRGPSPERSPPVGLGTSIHRTVARYPRSLRHALHELLAVVC